ncbi:MAG: hypothetical protein IKR40_07770 [Treponema sp.]|nr:hypothetical protein [Treponema sp.]
MNWNVFGNFIGNIFNLIFKRASVKESTRVNEEPEESEECFTVRKPRWMTPVLLICAAVFVGFAIFSYKADVKIGAVIFIAFAAATLFALIWESEFSIRVDGQQISVSRLFGGEKIFHANEIISCSIDNAHNVIVEFETGKIKVDGMQVNAILFYNIAQHYLYMNLETQKKRRYKIRRKKSELILVLISALICAAFLSLFIVKHESFSIRDMILASVIFGGVVLISIIYIPVVLSRHITVDEESGSFSFTKGFRHYTASLPDVIEAHSKKRFGEANAVNYTLRIVVQNPDGKSKVVSKKFCSLDENATRFVSLIVNEFEKEENFTS